MGTPNDDGYRGGRVLGCKSRPVAQGHDDVWPQSRHFGRHSLKTLLTALSVTHFDNQALAFDIAQALQSVSDRGLEPSTGLLAVCKQDSDPYGLGRLLRPRRTRGEHRDGDDQPAHLPLR
jgi:hypothetical protein